MAVSNIRADFHAELQKVWEIVTSLEDTAWRSDLSRVEIIRFTYEVCSKAFLKSVIYKACCFFRYAPINGFINHFFAVTSSVKSTVVTLPLLKKTPRVHK